MRVKSSIILAAAFCLLAAQPFAAQDQGTSAPPQQASIASGAASEALGTVTDGVGIKRYQLGPGDVLELRVYNDPTLTGKYRVDDDGFIDVPLIGTIPAKCRTDLEMKQDIITGLRKYLKSPSVSLSIVERNSRPNAVVYGAVRSPTRAQMNRRVRLIELMAVAGGATEQAGGDIQIYHTEALMCPGPEDLVEMQQETKGDDALAMPFNIYRMEDVRLGKLESNPFIRPGDIVIVHEAPPIYVTGPGVRQPSNLYLKNNMSLTRALAQVGGVVKGAKSDKVRIYRQKPGQLEPEVVIVNYDAIRNQKAQDVALQAYDIIEVRDQSAWTLKNLPTTLLNLATSGASQVVSGGAVRIIN